MSTPDYGKLKGQPGYNETGDSFLLDGNWVPVQAVVEGEIPGLRWNPEKNVIESARAVERNAYGKMTYSLWGSPDPEELPTGQEILWRITEGTMGEKYPMYTPFPQGLATKLMQIGFTEPFINYVTKVTDPVKYLLSTAEGYFWDIPNAQYNYEQYLAMNPLYEDTIQTGTRGGAEPVRGYEFDYRALKEAVVTGMHEAIAKQRAEIERTNALLEEQNRLIELQTATESQNEKLANENLLQFMARKLTEGSEGQTKSWEDFFNRVFPKVQVLGNLMKGAVELTDYGYRTGTGQQLSDRELMRAKRDMNEVLSALKQIGTGTTFEAPVRVTKKSTYGVGSKRAKYSTREYYTGIKSKKTRGKP